MTGVTLSSAGTGALATVAGGPYAITVGNAAGTGLANYVITYVNGALTVDPRPLAIAAGNRIKTYGDSTTFAGTEFTAAGLVNSDTVTGVVLTSTGAPAAAGAGTYDIMPSSAAGVRLDNYAITYISGTLTVNRAGAIWTVTSSPASSAAGRPVTLVATVNNAEATGTVTFLDGGVVLGSATLAYGRTTFITSDLSVGSHYITIRYDGDSNFTEGSSLAHVLAVKEAPGFNWWWIIISAAIAGGFFFFLVLRRRRKKKQEASV